MRLYYFTTERFGLEAIRDRRLKLARIHELNDPFELLGLSLPGRENRDVREGFRRLKQTMSESFGLMCMSRNWHNPLLWSHYADKHQGLCLGFDGPDKSSFKRLDYLDERLTLQDFGGRNPADFNLDDMDKLLRTKFRAWEYETEYRAYYRLKDCDPVSDLYFVNFSKKMRLAQVIVGERSKVTRDRLDRCLGERANAVRAIKARSAFKKFEVVENKRKSAWQ